MTDSTTTLHKLARDAVAVQDACNLRAVLGAAHEASLALGRLPECTGTDWINTHPVMVLYADKIASLTGVQNLGNEAFGRAYAACLDVGGEPDLATLIRGEA
jgi:hypothetical protein